MQHELRYAEEQFGIILRHYGGDPPALIGVERRSDVWPWIYTATMSDGRCFQWAVDPAPPGVQVTSFVDYLDVYARVLVEARRQRTYCFADLPNWREVVRIATIDVTVVGVDPGEERAAREQIDMISMLADMNRRIENAFVFGDARPHTYRGLREMQWPAPEATGRAESLLRDWLSPQQAAELDAAGHFHVTGCDTGTRYRIMRGTAQNVYELGADAKPKVGLCFGPAGGLVEGDVMLAQKISLETREGAALAKANRFGHELRVRLPAEAWRSLHSRNVFLTEFEEPPRRPANPQPPIDSAAWTGR